MRESTPHRAVMRPEELDEGRRDEVTVAIWALLSSPI
jgi:hypothetical protein